MATIAALAAVVLAGTTAWAQGRSAPEHPPGARSASAAPTPPPTTAPAMPPGHPPVDEDDPHGDDPHADNPHAQNPHAQAGGAGGGHGIPGIFEAPPDSTDEDPKLPA